MVFFSSSVVGGLFCALWVAFGLIVFSVVSSFMCLWEEVSALSSYSAIFFLLKRNILKDNEFYRISPYKYTRVDWVNMNGENWAGRACKMEVSTLAYCRPQSPEGKVLQNPQGLDSVKGGKRKWQKEPSASRCPE